MAKPPSHKVSMVLASLSNIGRVRASLIAVGLVIVTTVFLLIVHRALNPTAIALTYVVAVLFSATLFGSRPGLIASLAGMFCFNFFFLPPFYTLTISGAENWTAFAAFIVTALIAGQLSAYARRRAAESEARKQKIERLYDELKDAFEQASEAEALRRSERLKTALLDSITHDLRTPLTSIKASVTTLLSDSEVSLGRESTTDLLEIIDEETDRLNEFIEGVVGIAKIEAGAADVSRSLSSVEEIIGNAVERARTQLVRYELILSVPSDLPQLDVDPISVSQVVFTLLDNAMKYSSTGFLIRISAYLTSTGRVRIVVEDQGRGIPRAERETVFDKFARLDAGNEAGRSGLGLGLTIAKGMLEAQNGRIWIEDGSPGFVTRVVCDLPTESVSSEALHKQKGAVG